MKYVFDLSGNDQRQLQFFPDAAASFVIPKTLDKNLSVLVWGIVYPEPQQDKEFCEFLPLSVRKALPTALYLSGWGILTFNDIQSGDVTVWPYEPTFRLDNLKLIQQNQGEAVSISHTWPGLRDAAGIDYLFSMILEQPLGFMALKIVAAGPVTLCVNPHDFITEEQLDAFPERYRFDLTRSRQLRNSPLNLSTGPISPGNLL